MTFVFALAFALMVLIASLWGGKGTFAALIIGLGLGAWLKTLIEQRIRSIVGEAPKPAAKQPGDVYAALEDIHWRLKRLETAKALGASPLEHAANTATEPAAEQPPEPALAKSDDTVFELDPWLTSPPPASAIPEAAAHAPAQPLATAIPTAAKAASTHSAFPEKNQAEDNVVASLIERGRAWFFGGNTVVRAGIVILFFGVAFLLKFAADHALLPLEIRLASVGAGALALLVIGWRLRIQREDYALALQGAGVGLFYLTLFSAFRLYHLVPPFLALSAMVAVSGLSALLAVVQNSRALIAIAVIGGFLAPILASTSSGNHVALFSYYAALNLGIFAVAWFKAWRPLNLLGFFFTFGIGLVWGVRAYQPELFASTEPFLILFFLMFLGIAVLFAQRQAPALGAWAESLASAADTRHTPTISPPAATRIVDSTLVFGLPLVAFGFQAALTRNMEFGLAYSALALSGIYLLLARWLFTRSNPHLRLLVESFLALGVIFATLAIPLALDARWTSASWALEGAAVLWVGIRQQRRLARVFGLLLQVAAALAFFNQDSLWADAPLPLLNAECMGATLIALAGLFSAWQLKTHATKVAAGETAFSLVIFAWGLGWWLLAGLHEAERWLSPGETRSVALLFMAATAALFSLLQRRLDWSHARLPAAGLIIGLLAVFAGVIVHGLFSLQHPLGHGGWAAWPLALLLHFWLLNRHDQEGFRPWFAWVHAAGFWLLAALGGWELYWLAQHLQLQGSWPAAALVVLPGLLLFSACREQLLAHWPLQHFAPSYLGWGAYPLVATLVAWCVTTDFTQNGNASPLPYLPLLNPIDLGHILIALVILRWALLVKKHSARIELPADNSQWRGALGIILFIWLNAMLLRSIHHWAGVPYTLHDMLDSVLVQAALSLFWSLIALTLMVAGATRAWRSIWMVGAALMAVVVGKLFMVDLGGIGSVARIVSFMGVGLLMLLIGYVAPVPPEQTGQEKP